LTVAMKPARDRDKLIALLPQEPPRSASDLSRVAVRLAGLWRLEAAGGALRSIAQSATVDEGLRAAAIDALATIGGPVGRSQIEALAAPTSPAAVLLLAVAALARLDVDAAAVRAVELIPQAAAAGLDLAPLMTAFLN